MFGKKDKPVEKSSAKEDGYKAYLERVAQSEARELKLAKMHCAEAEKNRRKK
jgi:hypothetical protein